MQFIREIGLQNITDKTIENLEQFGFSLVWKEDSVEVWVEKGV